MTVPPSRYAFAVSVAVRAIPLVRARRRSAKTAATSAIASIAFIFAKGQGQEFLVLPAPILPP
jgi:hypothetical protein